MLDPDPEFLPIWIRDPDSGLLYVINFEEKNLKNFRWKNLVYNQSFFKLLYEIVMALEETFSQLNL